MTVSNFCHCSTQRYLISIVPVVTIYLEAMYHNKATISMGALLMQPDNVIMVPRFTFLCDVYKLALGQYINFQCFTFASL